MGTDYIIREFNDKDEDQILELLEQAFQRKISQDHWRWKYFDNPLKKQVIVVAEKEEQIVGCSHTYYRELKFGKKIHLMGIGGDAAVHKEHRRKGLHTNIVKLKDKF